MRLDLDLDLQGMSLALWAAKKAIDLGSVHIYFCGTIAMLGRTSTLTPLSFWQATADKLGQNEHCSDSHPLAHRLTFLLQHSSA